MKAEKIGRRKLAGINLTEQAKPAPAPGDDNEESSGFVLIADAQVVSLADGITGPGTRSGTRPVGKSRPPPPGQDIDPRHVADERDRIAAAPVDLSGHEHLPAPLCGCMITPYG